MTSNTKKQGGFLTLIIIARRNIRRNMRRTGFCILAVGIAVFFNIFMHAWISGMTASIETVIQIFDMGHVNVVSAQFEAEKEYMPVQYPVADGRSIEELSTEIKGIPGVKAVLPRIASYATLQDSVVKHAVLWGLDIEAEQRVNYFNLTDRNNGLVQGRFPKPGTKECAVGTEFARKSGLSIGDSIPLKTVSAQFSDKLWNPEIVGIFEFDYRKYDEGFIIVPFDRLQRLLVLGEASQQLFIYADTPGQSRAIATEIRARLGDGSVVREWQDNYWVAMMRQSMLIFVVVFVVFQIVASFLIVNTVVMIVHERIKEIGMMGSLGMTRGEIVVVFFFEAVFLSVLGSFAGCVLGGVSSWIGSLFPMDIEMFTGGGMKEFPMAGSIFLQFSPAALVQGFFFGVVVASVCTLLPSLKSAFIEPVEALRR